MQAEEQRSEEEDQTSEGCVHLEILPPEDDILKPIEGFSKPQNSANIDEPALAVDVRSDIKDLPIPVQTVELEAPSTQFDQTQKEEDNSVKPPLTMSLEIAQETRPDTALHLNYSPSLSVKQNEPKLNSEFKLEYELTQKEEEDHSKPIPASELSDHDEESEEDRPTTRDVVEEYNSDGEESEYSMDEEKEHEKEDEKEEEEDKGSKDDQERENEGNKAALHYQYIIDEEDEDMQDRIMHIVSGRWRKNKKDEDSRHSFEEEEDSQDSSRFRRRYRLFRSPALMSQEEDEKYSFRDFVLSQNSLGEEQEQEDELDEKEEENQEEKENHKIFQNRIWKKEFVSPSFLSIFFHFIQFYINSSSFTSFSFSSILHQFYINSFSFHSILHQFFIFLPFFLNFDWIFLGATEDERTITPRRRIQPRNSQHGRKDERSQISTTCSCFQFHSFFANHI